MRVFLSGRARNYLKQETAYLRKYSPAAARAFVARIAEARANLASFPDIGVGIMAPPVPGTRRLVVGNYILDYELGDETITVLSIRHGQQSPAAVEIEPDFDYEDDSD